MQDFVHEAEGVKAVFARQLPDMPMRAHHTLPVPELGYILAVRPLNLSCDNSRRDGANDAVGNLVLKRENVFKSAIITVRPDMVPGPCVDQLRDNAHPIASLPHATFENVAHTKFTTELGTSTDLPL